MSRRVSSAIWQDIHAHFHVGQVVTSTVACWVEHGVLLKLSDEITGRMRQSEFSWYGVVPQDVLQIGDKLDVVIISIDEERQRIRLSRRALLAHPREDFAKTTKIGAVFHATVHKIKEYGVLVELAPGVHGLLHRSMIADALGADVNHQTLTKGEVLTVRIVNMVTDGAHIELALV